MKNLTQIIFIFLSFQLCLIAHHDTSLVSIDGEVSESIVESIKKSENETDYKYSFDDFSNTHSLTTIHPVLGVNCLIYPLVVDIHMSTHLDIQVCRGPPSIS
jgi:hypothetical protein